MIGKVYRTATDAVTGAVAVDWSIDGGGDFFLHRITFKVSVIPTTAGSLTITLNSQLGAAYDCVLDTIDMVAAANTDIVASTNLGPFMAGDKILVEYANADSRTISSTATYEI